MFKLEYDPNADAAYLRFSRETIIDSEEVSPGIVLDFDEAGLLVGMEVLDATRKLSPTVLQIA
ncbi:DUF2283 domain-containing protein [Mesorhizobium sp. RP14(2022)]|uniref:DUF2283 domain-containing protein n=1 Tax=Mesorhizobium liriopis TaxID=2953882 RepID=A0ABT1C341_9HYPH|nr:DUF2283 domain-containing protein [Mesorhizobium liriopis]